MEEPTLVLNIKHKDGEREINIHAESMSELIDVKLPKWLPSLKEDLPVLKTLKRFKKDPKGEEQKERDSGSYYDVYAVPTAINKGTK